MLYDGADDYFMNSVAECVHICIRIGFPKITIMLS